MIIPAQTRAPLRFGRVAMGQARPGPPAPAHGVVISRAGPRQNGADRSQTTVLSAPIAPIARHRHGGKAFTICPSMPPSAATVVLAPPWRAIAAQRRAPRPGAPAWLAVGKAGDRNTRSAPAR